MFVSFYLVTGFAETRVWFWILDDIEKREMEDSSQRMRYLSEIGDTIGEEEDLLNLLGSL